VTPGTATPEGGVAAVVRSSTIGPLNNRTDKKKKKKQGTRRKNSRAASYSGPMKIQAFERCYNTDSR